MALIAKKNFAIIAAVAVVAGLGAAGIAAANGGGSSIGIGDDDADVVGTVKAPAEPATEQTDAEESAALEAVATVTPEEAKTAAATAAGGTATRVEIEEEDGYVVYDVEVTTKSGTTDVTVDAGNGKVLQQDQDGPEDRDDVDDPDDEQDD